MKNRVYIKDFNNISSLKDKYKSIQNKIKEVNKTNLVSLCLPQFKHINNANSKLNGVMYSLKDNIAVKDEITTGGSKFLSDYKPPYNSTVKNLLDAAGAICVSKDNLDEFGLGGTGLFSGFDIVKHPLDHKRIPGGSSSGSTCLVAMGIVPFAICTDTGDSIRRPASLQGVIGFKPTYGTISRYGVYPYSPSLDHVGVIANSIDDVATIMDVVAKHDPLDMTSIDLKCQFTKNLKSNKKVKLVVLVDALDNMSKNEKELFKKHLDKLASNGFNISYESFSVELLKLIDPIYKAISYSEATTCWANLSGILFGNNLGGNDFEDILMKNRTNFFGRQLKRRFVIGAYCTSSKNYEEIFMKSKKIRTLIINRANELFKKYDALIMPGSSRIAPLIEDELNHKSTTNICDDALQIANFAGLPSITIPAIEYNKLFVGLNITGKLKDDLNVLNIAKAIMEVK